MQENVKADSSVEAEQIDRSVTAVFDRLLNELMDKVLNAQDAIKDNTTQLRVMANTVETVRGIPAKMEELTGRIEASLKGVGGVKEKMGALEKAIGDLGTTVGNLNISVASSLASPYMLNSKMTSLDLQLTSHANAMSNFETKCIYHKHKHQLDSFAWIIVGLVLICGVLGAVSYSKWTAADQYRASDIKWRGEKVLFNGAERWFCDSIDQRYMANPEAFKDSVVREEERLQALAEDQQQLQVRQQELDAKKAEIDALKKKGKKN